MVRNEFTTLLKRIKDIYTDFDVNDEEWWNILKDYSYNEVINNLQNYNGNHAPIYKSLITGLKKEKKRPAVKIQCDICRELVTVADDWEVFETHHRKCSKIDFIDRQSQKLRGEPIDKEKYYALSDEELDSIYRKVMDMYLKTRDNASFIKRIPNED